MQVNHIEANPFQPRTEFDQAALEELAASIRIHGLIQPITVRKMGYDQFQIISGERRTRASILAGLKEIPAYVRVANDQEMLEMALIENIQRENLNSIEVALSYQRLVDEVGLKLEELGERVGKNRSTVNNYLRLLRLPVLVQAGIRDGKISMGHARAIINIDSEEKQMALFQQIIDNDLSVRAIEEIARDQKQNTSKRKPAGNKADYTPYHERINELADKLDAPVKIRAKEAGGEVILSFDNEQDLERLLELL